MIATKPGDRVDAAAKNVTAYGASDEGSDVVPHMRADLETSLSNLGTVHIDRYRFHPGGLVIARYLPVRGGLELFVAKVKIRA